MFSLRLPAALYPLEPRAAPPSPLPLASEITRETMIARTWVISLLLQPYFILPLGGNSPFDLRSLEAETLVRGRDSSRSSNEEKGGWKIRSGTRRGQRGALKGEKWRSGVREVFRREDGGGQTSIVSTAIICLVSWHFYQINCWMSVWETRFYPCRQVAFMHVSL